MQSIVMLNAVASFYKAENKYFQNTLAYYTKV